MPKRCSILIVEDNALVDPVLVVTQFNPSAFYTLTVTIHPKPNPLITHAPYPTCPVDTSHGSTGRPDRKRECEKVCKYSVIIYSTVLNAGSTYLWVVSGASNVSGEIQILQP